ncbi:MAG: putative secreted (periplasmic) protein [Phenylobacterium sp.]|jgi:LPS-assembly lipoprotein|uniref:LPS assembly lipoprotein LptE n=1 Tax=Phenylobacterium sp. TaxID=1871053 RepID=UPI002632BE48|nr:LPS assembly lipoprotein LptE [Phenylobacterium sp.]MDB5497213.1 putative secreted (periplasmic) protein [Phenylobacterium sp.]
MRRFLVLAAACGALTLAGCGFTPLYAQPGVVSNLAAIDVTAPGGRTGFLLRQHLDDAFAKNRTGPAKYAMRLSLSEARYPRGIRTDNVATRYEYVLTADYTLANLPAGDIAKKGRVRVELTYDSADQPYASIAAQQDAEDRGAEEVARRIQLELAAWLATGEPKASKTPTVVPPKAAGNPRKG